MENKKIRTKEIEDKDFESFKKLFKNLKETSLMTITEPEELAKSMIKIKHKHYGKVLAIKENNKLIGFTNAVFMEPRRMEIGIGFFEEYRGKGIGTKAVKQLEKKLREAYPSRKITLNAKIKEENEASKKLFEKLGYKRGEKKGDKITFAKELFS